jgi:DNA-binding response OmpR family regulator
MSACPCCGGPLPDLPLRVSLDHNRILCGARTAPLPPSVAVFAHVLVEANGRPVRRARIADAIYGVHGGPDTWNTVLAQHASRLRRILRDLGYGIEAVRPPPGAPEGGAYRLVRIAP